MLLLFTVEMMIGMKQQKEEKETTFPGNPCIVHVANEEQSSRAAQWECPGLLLLCPGLGKEPHFPCLVAPNCLAWCKHLVVRTRGLG